jgi:hypothetical protein
MLRIDPSDGTLRVAGCAEAIPRTITHAEFARHPAAARLKKLRSVGRRHWYDLPDHTWEGFRVVGTISFSGSRLVQVYVQLVSDDLPGGDDRMLAAQERWLREAVGCPSDDYPWGLVWNRFNINAAYHDVSILFKHPEPERQPGAARVKRQRRS